MDKPETNLWTLVNKYPYNPHLWTELVIVAEKSHNYDGIVSVYNGFLKQFPLQYVYWNKLALIKRSKTLSARESVPIFMEALKPENLYYSTDMWFCYCDFIKTYSAEFTEFDIRDVFEQAIKAVGTDYNSDKIWLLYLNWEKDRGNDQKASLLFSRILSTPIKNLDNFWTIFTKHITNHPIVDCATPEELTTIDQEVSQLDLVEIEQINEARATRVYELRTAVFQQTLERVKMILPYELRIHRTYFHFQLPSPEEMATWSSYIKFTQQSDDAEQTKHLYERCLIPCNLSVDVWFSYVYYLQYTEGNDSAIAALNRAEQTALSIDPSFWKSRGEFFELINDAENAQKSYEQLTRFSTAEAQLSLAMFRRRASQEFIGDITNFFKETQNAKEASAVAAYLFKIGELTDTDKLLSLAECDSLALSVLVSIYEAHEQIENGKSAFECFLSKSKDAEDKVIVNRAMLEYLYKHNAPISEIRKVQRQQILLESELRKERKVMRREEVKKGAELTAVLEQWMNFFRENEQLISEQNE